jgi:hypothetical protein
MKRLEVKREVIEVTSLMELDPSWSFTDKAGHVHRAAVLGDIVAVPGTLCYVIDVEATDGYPECGHHECAKCRERVAPGYRTPPYRRYVHGRDVYLIDGREASREDFEKELAGR